MNTNKNTVGSQQTMNDFESGANVPDRPPQGLFKPFSWHTNPNSRDRLLAEATRDIAAGIKLALQMIEADELAVVNLDAPILSVTERGILMRFALSSAHLLVEVTDDNIDAHNKREHGANRSACDASGMRGRAE